jgi:Mn-dependent DtxR family transcriptional regulator
MKNLNDNSVLIERVFELLKRRGPLCQSQLSVHLLASTRDIEKALQQLTQMGIVEHRPDRNPVLREIEEPWGLRTPKLGKG